MSMNPSTPLAQTWKRRIERWQRSGLSAATFGRQEKVSVPRLYTWRKRFAAWGTAPKTVPAPLSRPTFSKISAEYGVP